jgi:hypothetical protein
MRTIDISYFSKDWRGSQLSNLTPSPFEFEGIPLACVESLVQSLNFSEDDLRHTLCLELYGLECQSMAFAAAEGVGGFHWEGREVSPAERDALIGRAIVEKFEVCSRARMAMTACGEIEFAYDPDPEVEAVSLNAGTFLDILRGIRDDFKSRGLMVL